MTPRSRSGQRIRETKGNESMSRKPSKEEQAAIRAALDAALDDLDVDESDEEVEEDEEEIEETADDGSVDAGEPEPSNNLDGNKIEKEDAEIPMNETSEARPDASANESVSETAEQQEEAESAAASSDRPPTPVVLDAKLAAAEKEEEEEKKVNASEAMASDPSPQDSKQIQSPPTVQNAASSVVANPPLPLGTAAARPQAPAPIVTPVQKSAEEEKEPPFLGPPRPPATSASKPPPTSSSGGGSKKKKQPSHAHHTTDPDKLFMEMMEDMLLTEQEGVTGPDEMMVRLVKQLQDQLHDLEEEVEGDGSDDDDEGDVEEDGEPEQLPATPDIAEPAAVVPKPHAGTNEESLTASNSVAPLQVEPAAPTEARADPSPISPPPPLPKVSKAGDPLPALRSEPNPSQSSVPEVAKPTPSISSQPAFSAGEDASQSNPVDPAKSKASSTAAKASSSSSKASSTKRKKESQQKSSSPPAADAEKDLDAAISQLIQGMAQQAAMADDGPDDSNDTSGNEEADLLNMLMKGLSGVQGGGTGGNVEEDDDFNADAMIDGMMEQLLSKDLMYDPMKQVAARFPKWLEERRNTLSAQELKKRQEQCDCFQKLVQAYETRPDDTAQLMALMQEVQEYGQPPAEIIHEIAPGMELDANGLPKLNGAVPPFGAGDNECSIM